MSTDLKSGHWIHEFHHLTSTKRPLCVSTADIGVNKIMLQTLKKGSQARNHMTKGALGNTGCFTVQPHPLGKGTF